MTNREIEISCSEKLDCTPLQSCMTVVIAALSEVQIRRVIGNLNWTEMSKFHSELHVDELLNAAV